jgi:predicted GTPase
MKQQRVIIMGAAGRDFHNFNTAFRDDDDIEVVAFTAAQIPNIAGRSYPTELAGPRYPQGIPIYSEDELERLVKTLAADQVIFSYSDVSAQHVLDEASRALACGADFRLLGPTRTCLRARLPVIAVCAARTGAGKSQTTRYVAARLRERGLRVGIVRHPMPYGDLTKQVVQRFASLADMERADCSIEEREEYTPHLEAGHVVYAGVDYGRVLEAVSAESDVILWDGGNNDYPFFAPDLLFTVVDPHRAGHERSYYPGQVNVRMADVVIVNKVDSAASEAVERVHESIRHMNPAAEIVDAASPVRADQPEVVRGKRVLVVEDGPTLTHGEMGFGAGFLAARELGCEVVDPRPYAVGSLRHVFEKWVHLGPILPAMGYGEQQRQELRQTIEAAPIDVVVVGTPIDLAAVLGLNTPAVRVRYDLEQRSGRPIAEMLDRVLPARAI